MNKLVHARASTNILVTTSVKRGLLLLLLAVVWALPSPTRCHGQETIYTSRSAFNNGLVSSTTITFEELPPTHGGIGDSPLTVSGVTFTNAESRLFIGPLPITGDGQYLWNFDSGYPVGIFLPPGGTAFGADFSGGIEPNASFNATLTVNLVGGQSSAYSFSAPRGTWTFFGVTSAQPIASVVYDDGGQFLPGTHEEMVDNVTFGMVAPEPSSNLLFLYGLMALLCGRRLRLLAD